jgi:hypothetical protein
MLRVPLLRKAPSSSSRCPESDVHRKGDGMRVRRGGPHSSARCPVDLICRAGPCPPPPGLYAEERDPALRQKRSAKKQSFPESSPRWWAALAAPTTARSTASDLGEDALLDQRQQLPPGQVTAQVRGATRRLQSIARRRTSDDGGFIEGDQPFPGTPVSMLARVPHCARLPLGRHRSVKLSQEDCRLSRTGTAAPSSSGRPRPRASRPDRPEPGAPSPGGASRTRGPTSSRSGAR